MKKLVYIPRHYYIIFRFIITIVLLELLSSLADGFYVGVIGVSSTITTIAYAGTLLLIFVDLYYGARYLLEIKKTGDRMLAELRSP